VPDGECVDDQIVRFRIVNVGADMQIPSEYRIYRDNLLAHTGSFQLAADDTLVVEIYATGEAIRFEADQHPLHPGHSHPNTTVTGCGSAGNPNGGDLVNELPQDDEDPEIEIDCLPIIDSYDPNDKQVVPSGIGTDRIVHRTALLEYMIRFQNTGTDTAYNVVVVDTLSQSLDISTIEWGMASHAYTLNVSGQYKPVLTFTFNNINLPDSTTHEPNSNGYIKFKIKPLYDIPNNTQIENKAYIYFDYNEAVETNTSHITIADSIPHGEPLVFNAVERPMQREQISVYPNPTTGMVSLDLTGFGNLSGLAELRLTDITGKELQHFQIFKLSNYQIDLSNLPDGMYFLHINTAQGTQRHKIILAR